jgi:hypothetical protein
MMRFGSHGGDYEVSSLGDMTSLPSESGKDIWDLDCGLLGCDTFQSGRGLPMFW